MENKVFKANYSSWTVDYTGWIKINCAPKAGSLLSWICSLNRNVVYKFKLNILSSIYAEKMNEFDEKLEKIWYV